MNAMPRPRSLEQLAALAAAGGEFSYLLGDFLDGFYQKPTSAALQTEPILLVGRHPKGAAFDAFLAATAQTLAAAQNSPAPPWIFGPDRYLRRPFFPVTAASLRATLLLESPPAFRARNLFVSANALNRA